MNLSGQAALKLGEEEPVSIPEKIATRRIGSDEQNLAEFPLGSIDRDKSDTGNSRNQMRQAQYCSARELL